ncbi:zinc finger CCHC-type containing 7 [Leptinotarsa decemlineata]|uniref:zinc finger CCHC-type containing 7 n=1 Tax=Leptinotarsa decemlineata TaxID=7539 RepID=UPI003D30C315
MEEDSDLEELEWRLYSQVYHSIGGNEENPISENAMDHVPSARNNVRKPKRYFQQKVQSDSPYQSRTYISLDKSLVEESSTSKIQNDFTFDSNSTTIITSSDKDQFHNNITVNQFTLPVIINPDRTLISQPEKYITSWSKETLKLLKLSKKDKKKQKKRIDKPKQSNEVTIFLSDDSDDCVIVENNTITNTSRNQEINTGFPKKYDELEGGKKPESDDDIVYIPPAPIEVIDIEENETEINPPNILVDKSGSKDISKKSTIENQLKNSSNLEESRDLVKTPESNASNDFLEHPSPENISTDFNFSLHGSDFNNSHGDFVRPSTKPVEYCETESSCSTNEQNRDFSNTVKTIVFDEVEFPKEDIFSEKNLESFSSFITPKRNTKSSKEISTNQSPKVVCENKQDHNTSSDDTSSESDYDHVNEIKLRIIENDPKYKNLPHLSPMTRFEGTPRKSISKALTAKSFLQSGSKFELEKIENSPTSEDRNYQLKKKQRKKKKKSSQRVIINSEDDDDDDNQYSSGSNEENTENKMRQSDCARLSNVGDSKEKSPTSSKQKRRKGKSVTSENHQRISDNEIINSLQEKSRKKRKKDVLVAEKSLENEANVAGSGETEVNPTSDPKEENDESQNIEDGRDVDVEKVIETVILPGKFKKKKRKSGPEILQDDSGLEISEGTADKLKKRKKKRDSTSEKLLSTEMEQQISVGNTVLSTNDEPIENKIDDSLLITESNSEPVNCEIEQNTSGFGTDLIVIDDTENNREVQVITFSDSESDSNFHNLEDISDEVRLANCFSSVEVTEEKNSTGKNICDSEISQGTAAFEEFDVHRVQRNQSDDPDKWKISHKDRATYLKMDGNKGPRCNRCRHFGHIALKCTEKPELPSCFLCGQRDHREPRCPNKRCTQCGNHGDYSTTYCWKCFKFRNYVCRLCKMKGHVENTCPDIWRRYHSTTIEGPIIISQGQFKPRHEQWCSGCARQGHLEHECNNYNREYPPTTPYIINYEDNLAEDKNKLPQSIVANEDSQECVPRNLDDSAPSTSSANNSAFYQPTIDALLMSNQFPFPNQQQPNQLSVLGLLPPPSQIGYLNQVLPPYTLKLFSQLPVLSQLQTMAMMNKQSVVPNPVNPNFINEISNRVLNPCSVPNSTSTLSSVNSTNEYYLDNAKMTKVIDEKEIKKIILSASFSVVNDFLIQQMEELRNTDIQPRLLKNKLYKYDNVNANKRSTTKFKREKSYWFRLLNMFIFGKHKIGDGQLHVNYLNKYLTHPIKSQLDDHKRRSLLSSYSYIFTYDKHKNVNYYKWINILIQKYEKRSINKYIS